MGTERGSSPVAKFTDVAPQLPRAVALDSAQIDIDQTPRDMRRVCIGHPDRSQRPGGPSAEISFCYAFHFDSPGG